MGMKMSLTTAWTRSPRAAPIITPKARSTILPFGANSLNSIEHRWFLLMNDDGGHSHQLWPAYGPPWPCPTQLFRGPKNCISRDGDIWRKSESVMTKVISFAV